MPTSYKNSLSGKGVFPPKYAFTLLIPLRNLFLSPAALIRRLALRDDQHVLEIGPGPGYFSVPVARKLSSGRLVLLDIQAEMLSFARKRLARRELANVDFVLTDGEGFDLESGRFDRVFMVTVIGEVDNKTAYLREIHRVMKDDGILSISELAGDPDKMSVDELSALVCGCGFAVSERFGNRFNYTIHFTKVPPNGD
ncbi:MAG: class I SAM-dependent methyltransferase [Candidatus Thiodiazotropha sp.]